MVVERRIENLDVLICSESRVWSKPAYVSRGLGLWANQSRILK